MTSSDIIVQIEGRRRPIALNPKMPPSLNALCAPSIPAQPVTVDEGRRFIRLGLLVITLAFGIGGLLLSHIPLASAIVASGMVKVADNRKSVQHLEGGIIKEIRVRNGDRVAAGQTLIVLEDERANASLDLLAGQWDAAAAKAARLQAERDFQPELMFPERLRARASERHLAQLLRMEAESFRSKRAMLERQIALFTDQNAELDQEIANLHEQLRAETAAGRLQAEELRVHETAFQRQLVSKVQVLASQRAQQQHQARVAELGAALARVRQRQDDLRLRTATTRAQYVQGAADELTAVNALLFDLEEKQRPSRDAVHRQAITAPLAGQIVDLQVFTVGGVARPGERLLDIVPEAEPLLIEARLGLDDIDNVRPGLAVDVRLTAYPTRSTPLVHGVVRYVSADQLSDPRTGVRHYIAQVAVDPVSLAIAGESVRLQPGMHAELFIKIGERTVLDYLLAPMTDTLRRSLREP